MIGKLTGTIDTIAEDHLILDVGGVGYIVFASSRTLQRLPGEGQTASLLVETHVREDHFHLFGFLDAIEKQWFTTLLSISGVGTKMALALQALDPSELSAAVLTEDKATFTRVNGVGPKLAARLVTELKGKVEKLATSVVPLPASSGETPAQQPAQQTGTSTAIMDAVSALANLGYSRVEALSAAQKAASETDSEDAQSLIKHALSTLSQHVA